MMISGGSVTRRQPRGRSLPPRTGCGSGRGLQFLGRYGRRAERFRQPTGSSEGALGECREIGFLHAAPCRRDAALGLTDRPR
jgi:hypothetical protein